MNTKYKHLNCEERTLIQLRLERGCTVRAIALSLNRGGSPISRDLFRDDYRCTSLFKPPIHNYGHPFQKIS
jgi:IS30 family transposase